MTGSRSRSKYQPLKLQTRYDIAVLAITVQIPLFGQIDIVPCRDDYGADLKLDFLSFLAEVDSVTCTASVHTLVAFYAVVHVDRIEERDGLVKRS